MDTSSSKNPVVDVDEENVKESVTKVDEESFDKPSRNRSWVWDHMVMDKETKRARCPYCKYLFEGHSKRNGTSSMSSHLKNVCTKSPVYKKVDKKKQSTLSFKPNSAKEGGGNLASHMFSQEKCRKMLARMCVKDNRPFSIVEDEGFREFVWELNPMFKFPSRWTVARDCLFIFEEERKKLKHLLRDQTISLTTDTWTSVQNFNYMCLTAHWVDADWVFRKKILNFCQIPNHKGETIGRFVYKCLEAWGIDRVFTVTVDNASSNDGAIRFLKTMLKGPHSILDCKYLHLRCNAHIINLVVKDGLDEQDNSISKIRNAIRYLRSSSSRFQSFKDCVKYVEIECKKKPCLDVETRWNSTYLMLESALKFEKAFERLNDVDFNYRAYFRSEIEDDEVITRKRKKNDRVLGAPDETDWENSRLFVEYLKIFHDVTKKISGSKYVTANLLFGEICVMHATISKMTLSSDESKKKMAESMKLKFDKYWDNLSNMNMLLYLALVLDPRNKMSYLSYCLGLIYGMKSVKVKNLKIEVEKTLLELYENYKKRLDKTSEGKSTVASSNVVDCEDVVDLEDGYLKYLEEECGEGINMSEVDIYLRDGVEKKVKGDDTYDVLGWWKINSNKFPILSHIARHILGIPISTVASESAFSIGGRVIDKYKSSLTPKTAESLICLQDWLRSTPTDLQESHLHGLQLEDFVDNLEKLENEFEAGKKTCNDSLNEDMDFDM